MSSIFLNEMQRNMEEDAALTIERPRQSLEEDRSPEQEDMTLEQEFMAIDQEDMPLQEDMMIEMEEIDNVQPTEEMDFMFDGLLEAIKRRINKE